MRAKDRTDRWPELAVTMGGLGYLPIAPGTWGTLGAAAIHALIGLTGHWFPLPVLALLCSAACVVHGPWAERFYGKKDPSPVVLDEGAGYFLAVSVFPCAALPWSGLAVFLIFRVFDVIKPFPAHRSQRLPAGWGIVADDLIAGLYAAAVVWGLSAIFPAVFSTGPCK